MYIKGISIDDLKDKTNNDEKFSASLTRYTELVDYCKKNEYDDEVNYDIYELLDFLYNWYKELNELGSAITDKVYILYIAVNDIYNNKRLPISSYYELATGFAKCLLEELKNSWVENEYLGCPLNKWDYTKKPSIFEKSRRNKLVSSFNITSTEFEELLKVIFDYSMKGKNIVSEEDGDKTFMIILLNCFGRITSKVDTEGYIKFSIVNYLETIQKYRIEL